MTKRISWAAMLVILAGGCAREPAEEPPPESPATAPVAAQAAVVPVHHSYFPRREDVDYWETVPRSHAAPQFLLQVHPRIKTPAEGPWMATFSDETGAVLVRLPELRVDVATGNFLFLCSRRHFPPGDWTIVLEVMEGGLSGLEPRQVFRFRVE